MVLPPFSKGEEKEERCLEKKKDSRRFQGKANSEMEKKKKEKKAVAVSRPKQRGEGKEKETEKGKEKKGQVGGVSLSAHSSGKKGE